jgi:hypothetical protein
MPFGGLRLNRFNNIKYPICHCERSVAIPNYTEPLYWAYTRSWPREGQSRFSLLFVFIGTQDGCAVCRHKSNQKGFQQKCFFAAQGLSPANRAEPRAAIILRYFVPTFPRASAKTCYAPATAPPTIVLPAFARSCSADRKKNKKNQGNPLILKIKVQTKSIH